MLAEPAKGTHRRKKPVINAGDMVRGGGESWKGRIR